MKGSDLAEMVQTTIGFLPQVLAPLVRRGWVDSAPGPTGGYVLSADLDDVSLLEVIEAVEGPLEQEVCVLDGGRCENVDRCVVHEAWMKARDQLYEELAMVPISRTEPRHR